jgi:hypothetical protein
MNEKKNTDSRILQVSIRRKQQQNKQLEKKWEGKH